MTVLAVLAPYRDMGIGSALLRGLLEAMEGGKIAGAEGARELYLHVWEENKEAVRERREGAGAGAVAPAGPADEGASRARARLTPHAPPRSTTPLPPLCAQIAFYQRAGFVADAAKVENYYKRIANPHAIVLRRHFSPPSPAAAASGSS